MNTLHCPHCKQDKPDGDFYKAALNVGRRGRSSWCKMCTKAQTRDRKRANPERYKGEAEYARNYYRASRAEAVAALGSCCVRCGLDDVMVLQIDHVNGDGYKNNRSGVNYSEIRSIARKEGLERFQLLCANCHIKKTRENSEHLSIDKRTASC